MFLATFTINLNVTFDLLTNLGAQFAMHFNWTASLRHLGLDSTMENLTSTHWDISTVWASKTRALGYLHASCPATLPRHGSVLLVSTANLDLGGALERFLPPQTPVHSPQTTAIRARLRLHHRQWAIRLYEWHLLPWVRPR
jgi:hypothetical protein